MNDQGGYGSSQGQFDVTYLMDIYGKRVENENGHIASRTGWLLTLNAFLVATVGVGVTQTDEGLALATLTVVGVLAGLSNMSCFFSNYWAARALDESSQRVSVELRRMFDEPVTAATNVGPEAIGALSSRAGSEADLWLSRLRLYGRDPRAEPERVGFWLPPSGVLHPWFLVPITFFVAFAVLPLGYAIHIGTSGFWAFVAVSSPAWLPMLLFGAGVAADHAYNARREGLNVADYRRQRRRIKQGERETAAARRAERRARNVG